MLTQLRRKALKIVRYGVMISSMVLVWPMIVSNAHSHSPTGGKDVRPYSKITDGKISDGKISDIDTGFIAQRSLSLKKKALTTQAGKAA